mmetsp:Transcript_62874/g.182397  ORF Transcript_62874/g.182397 Transcript_62874/m.182397 type:complete len:252 (-) Transcript_62874:796-1551(-)
MVLLLELREAVDHLLVEYLHRIAATGGEAGRLEHVSKDRVLQVALDVVHLAAALNLVARGYVGPSRRSRRRWCRLKCRCGATADRRPLGDAFAETHGLHHGHLPDAGRGGGRLHAAHHDGGNEAVDHRPSEFHVDGEVVAEALPDDTYEALGHDPQVPLVRAVGHVPHAELLQSRDELVEVVQPGHGRADGHEDLRPDLPQCGGLQEVLVRVFGVVPLAVLREDCWRKQLLGLRRVVEEVSVEELPQMLAT